MLRQLRTVSSRQRRNLGSKRKASVGKTGLFRFCPSAWQTLPPEPARPRSGRSPMLWPAKMLHLNPAVPCPTSQPHESKYTTCKESACKAAQGSKQCADWIFASSRWLLQSWCVTARVGHSQFLWVVSVLTPWTIHLRLMYSG